MQSRASCSLRGTRTHRTGSRKARADSVGTRGSRTTRRGRARFRLRCAKPPEASPTSRRHPRPRRKSARERCVHELLSRDAVVRVHVRLERRSGGQHRLVEVGPTPASCVC